MAKSTDLEPRAMSKMNSNVKKVTDFMNFGSPLRQAFVLEALRRYSQDIQANKERVRVEARESFINPDAWIQCADDWAKEKI